MTKDNGISKFDDAIMLLPSVLRKEARQLSGSQRSKVEEIRLRKGRLLSVLMPDGELDVGTLVVNSEHINSLLDIATGVSAHSFRESIKNGYISKT